MMERRFGDLRVGDYFSFDSIDYVKIVPTIIQSDVLTIFNAYETHDNSELERGAWFGDDDIVFAH